MTNAEIRTARKAARAAGHTLAGELALNREHQRDDRDHRDPMDFSETRRGRATLRYDALNGAPEGEWDTRTPAPSTP